VLGVVARGAGHPGKKEIIKKSYRGAKNIP